MNWLLAAPDLADLMEKLRVIESSLEVVSKLLEASQGNLQYYIGGAVAVFMAGGMGILWNAYTGEKEANEKKEERMQERHETQIQKLVAQLRESGAETIKALNEKTDTAIKAAELVSENTQAITALKTSVDELLRLQRPAPGGGT